MTANIVLIRRTALSRQYRLTITESKLNVLYHGH